MNFCGDITMYYQQWSIWITTNHCHDMTVVEKRFGEPTPVPALMYDDGLNAGMLFQKPRMLEGGFPPVTQGRGMQSLRIKKGNVRGGVSGGIYQG